MNFVNSSIHIHYCFLIKIELIYDTIQIKFVFYPAYFEDSICELFLKTKLELNAENS